MLKGRLADTLLHMTNISCLADSREYVSPDTLDSSAVLHTSRDPGGHNLLGNCPYKFHLQFQGARVLFLQTVSFLLFLGQPSLQRFWKLSFHNACCDHRMTGGETYIIAVSLLLSAPASSHGKRTGEGDFSLSISECSRRSNQAQIHTLTYFSRPPVGN